MKSHILKLFKGSFIYGTGQILYRIVAFFLLPLTTGYLTPGDYGILGSLGIITPLVIGLFTLGLGGSLARSYWTAENEHERIGTIWMGFVVLLLNSITLFSIATFYSDNISTFFLGDSRYGNFVILTFATIALSSITVPFSTYFILKEKAPLIVTLSTLEILINIGLSISLLIFFHRGVKGVLEASVIAQGVSLILLLLLFKRKKQFSLRWGCLSEMLLIGYPYIFGLSGYFLLQYCSRYLLQLYGGMEQVGLFFMGSNFGKVIDIVIAGFTSAWPPFFISFLNKQDEALKVFGRVFSYYVVGMSSLLVLLFTLARPVVYMMVKPAFYDVWRVVGLLATAQVLWGIHTFLGAAFILKKKTVWQVILESGAGILCIGLNYLLIPTFFMMGAAIATVLSFLGLIIVNFFVCHALFPIQYEIKRIMKVIVALIGAVIISFIPIASDVVYNGIMMIVTFVFYFYLWCACVTTSEKQFIWDFFSYRRRVESA